MKGWLVQEGLLLVLTHVRRLAAASCCSSAWDGVRALNLPQACLSERLVHLPDVMLLPALMPLQARGIIPRAIEDVFGYIQRDTGERCKFLVRASYLQIYNEVRRSGGVCLAVVCLLFVCRTDCRCCYALHIAARCCCLQGLHCVGCLQVISDLLKPESQNLVVREDRRRGVHVEGLSEWVVRSPAGG